jgi:hypothetical protein
MTAANAPDGGWEALRTLAFRLAERRTAEVPLAELSELEPHLPTLIEAGVLVERAGAVRFFHETLFDHVLARAFVEDGRSLVEEVLGHPQNLSRRPLIRRILTFERGVDRERYRGSIRALLGSPQVRFHLRDVIFDVMREDAEPLASDWELIAPMVVDEDDENHIAAWNVAVQSPYLRVIDRTGTLLRWMVSDEEADRNRATSLLRHLLRDQPARGATLMWPFLELGDSWHTRIRWVLLGAAPEKDRRLMNFLLAALDAGVFDGAQDSDSLWLAADDLPSERPKWGVELLAAYLNRAIGRTPESNPFDNTIPLRSHNAEEFIRTLARRAPALFAQAVLPVVVDIVVATADPGRTIAQGDPWSFRSSTPGHGVDDALFESLDSALRDVADRRSERFAQLVPALIEQAHLRSLRFLLYRGWTGNPKAFWRPALIHLLEATDAFECGYMDSPYWVTRELLTAIQSAAPKSALEPLEQKILAFYSDWERSPEGHRSHGLAQHTLLGAFADNKLSEIARRRQKELRRKFGSSEEGRPRGIQSGYVSSPISDVKARKMTDRSWLRAIRRYGTDAARDRADFLKGGAVELSRVLEQQVKEEPARFGRLALRFPPDVDENYVDAVLRGLGDAEDAVSVDLVARVLRHFFMMPGRPGGRWITKPLTRLADKEIPTDVLDIVSWHATDSPDPQRDTWRKLGVDDNEYYGGDPLTAGINSVRGAAAEAISVLVWPSAERLAYFIPTLEKLACDPVIAVRVCAALTLRSVYRHDRDLAVDLFVHLTDVGDALLATRPSEDFLTSATKSHLTQLRPVLSKMLASPSPEVQAAAGRQVALAALDNHEASDLVNRAMSGPPSTRLGVAQVAAHNIINIEVGDTCAQWLPKFFNDDDQSVRREAASWLRQLGPTGIRQRRGLAIAYIDSAAYRDDESGLLHALDDSTVPVVDIALPALHRFIEHRHREIGDIQHGAAYAATIASKLAIRAYTSAQATDDREQALDIIDALLAAKVSEMRSFVESFD